MSETSGSTCPVDLQDGLARVGDDEEFYRELLDMFLEDAPARIESLRRAVADADADAIACGAHGLKGAAANLSAISYRDAAHALEKAGRDGRTEAFEELFEELRRESDRLAEFAKSF